jgi:acetoacetyl-CoA synthetase
VEGHITVRSEAAPEDGVLEERVSEGTVLWEPTAQRTARSQMRAYTKWLEESRGLVFAGYQDLWKWSVDRLDEFWTSVWEYFDVGGEVDPSRVLLWGNGAEGATWFADARLNYVDALLRQPDESMAIIACVEDETAPPEELTYGQLRENVGAAARGLRRLGVGPGDRVAAVLPNGLHAIVAFLATASIGAIWSSCAPEFGVSSLVDRFRQIEPKVLLAATSYSYKGRRQDLTDKIARLVSELECVIAVVEVPNPIGTYPGAAARLGWEELLAEPAAVEAERVPFSHPLWILYSSGTTGLPKPIVHSHGGIVLEHLKAVSLHCDLKPGDRFFWFTTTGWMMWNFLIGGLLLGVTVVCYDGDPLWPDALRLWRLARDVGITYFGTSAPYIEACRRSGVLPKEVGGLDVHTVGSTGAPLSPEGFAWASTQIAGDVLVGSVSGGTDVCTGFLCSCPWLEVRAGELQCKALGVAVEAYDEDGRSIVDAVGELVVTEPMPSMPVRFWGDDGTRLHDSYFAHFPGVWRHGDWVKLTAHGSAVLYGRSDATLNRGGVRMGTAEFYRVLEGLPGVADALVVDTSELGRRGELILFVVLDPETDGPEREREREVIEEVRATLREKLSPRHVPDRVIRVRSLPRTINGKKLEVPVRRILLGTPPEKAVAQGAIGDPAALEELLVTISGEGLR